MPISYCRMKKCIFFKISIKSVQIVPIEIYSQRLMSASTKSVFPSHLVGFLLHTELSLWIQEKKVGWKLIRIANLITFSNLIRSISIERWSKKKIVVRLQCWFSMTVSFHSLLSSLRIDSCWADGVVVEKRKYEYCQHAITNECRNEDDFSLCTRDAVSPLCVRLLFSLYVALSTLFWWDAVVGSLFCHSFSLCSHTEAFLLCLAAFCKRQEENSFAIVFENTFFVIFVGVWMFVLLFVGFFCSLAATDANASEEILCKICSIFMFKVAFSVKYAKWKKITGLTTLCDWCGCCCFLCLRIRSFFFFYFFFNLR